MWLSDTNPSLLEWLTIARVRIRAELDTRVTGQAAIATGEGCGDRAHPRPRPTLLMWGGTLVGGNTFHICSLVVGRAARSRRAAGTFPGSSQGAARGHSVRRRRCARVVNHILIGWRFEGAEEACRKEWYDWLTATRGELVVTFLLGKVCFEMSRKRMGMIQGPGLGGATGSPEFQVTHEGQAVNQ